MKEKLEQEIIAAIFHFAEIAKKLEKNHHYSAGHCLRNLDKDLFYLSIFTSLPAWLLNEEDINDFWDILDQILKYDFIDDEEDNNTDEIQITGYQLPDTTQEVSCFPLWAFLFYNFQMKNYSAEQKKEFRCIMMICPCCEKIRNRLDANPKRKMLMEYLGIDSEKLLLLDVKPYDIFDTWIRRVDVGDYIDSHEIEKVRAMAKNGYSFWEDMLKGDH